MKYKAKFLAAFLLLLTAFSFGLRADDGTYIVKFTDGYVPDMTEYALEEVYARQGLYLTYDIGRLKPIEKYIESISPNEVVYLIEDEILPDDEISFCEDAEFTVMSLPRDNYYSQQWHLPMITADAAWNFEAYGNEIRVAVIDSGCSPHPDIAENLLEGKNYFDGSTDVTDNNGHGTHVSGIIAAQMNGMGCVGVAPKAKIVPLKCFDPNENTLISDLTSAIYEAVDVYGCQIINMSWGADKDAPDLKNAIEYAADKGVILVAAAGNYGTSQSSYPAAYDDVIGVSSINENKEKSTFAQYYIGVTVTAPGENIVSLYKGGNKYARATGTSQATPQIAGMAAIALSMDPDMANAEFVQLLTGTAEDLGDEGYDVMYGYGLVSMEAFIDALFEDIPYYVSPINANGDETYVLIKNNTDSDFSAVSIFSKYNGRRFVGRSQYMVTLPVGGATTVRIDNGEKREISHFLWGSAEYIRPFTAKRDMLN